MTSAKFNSFLAALFLCMLPFLISGLSSMNLSGKKKSKFKVPSNQDAEKQDLFVKWMSSDSLTEIRHPGVSLEVIGSIPPYVKGTYIKNGPGLFGLADGSRRYTHAFDGLAKLQRFEIQGNNDVTFTTRLVDSTIKRAMLNSKRPFIPAHLSTGPVDPPFPIWKVLLNSLNFDNTCVNFEEISSSGVFCAVTDASIRTEIDPITLETRRRIPDGKIEGVEGIAKLSTAHSKVARRDGKTYNYYLEMGFQTWAHIVRTDTNLSQKSIGKVLISGQPSYVHEISVTDNYAVLCMHPLFLDFAQSLKQGALLPSLKFDSSCPTLIHIFDLQGIKPVRTFEAPPCWSYHHVNAFEVGSDVILDLIAYEDASITNGPHAYLYMENMETAENRAKQAKEGTLWRFTMNMDIDSKLSKVEKKTVYNLDNGLPTVMELVSISPECRGKAYRYVYGFTGFYKGEAGYLDWAIVKQDVSLNQRHGVWHEEYCYPGEPTFIYNPEGSEEDDGVLISTVYDSKRGENFLLVLDASSMKEIARAYTGVGFPQSFHGKFFPSKG